MPFLGNAPTDQYQSLAKQTITGDGSTAYTLNRSVTNEFEIEVFINNVRQEPTTSYTASGNTITFSAAVTASDSCYLIYQGQSVGSINPPAGSVGTSQVANNSITTAHMHTSYALPAQSSALDITTTTHANASVFKSTGHSQLFLQDTDSGLNAKFWGFQNSNSEFNILTCNDDRASAFVTPFTMKQSGAISTPLQPLAVTYYTAATQDGAYGAGASNRNMITCKPNGAYHNVGNMYDSNTGRYTVTEPGIYRAGFNGSNYNNNISNYYYIFIRKNASVQSYTYNGSASNPTWVHLSGQTFFTMAAGDYIDFYSAHDSSGADKGGFDISQYTTFYVEKVR